MKITSLFLLVALYVTHCSTTKNAVATQPIAKKSTQVVKDGKCFDKCIIGDEYKDEDVEYVVFTGNAKEEQVELKKEKLILRPAFTKWEKRPGDRNCLSKDPNDCLVWCLVDVPEEFIEYITPKDPSTTESVEVKTAKKKILVKKGGFTEWKEVVCEDQITPELVSKVQGTLTNLGYDPGPEDTTFGSRTKSALTKFQKDNGLPVGKLDVETMAFLEIDID